MECMFQLLSPKLDALGSPRETPARWEEFVKSWPRQWQTLVALFAEKRKGLKENVAPADFTGSSGDEFLCPDCGNVFPTLRRLKCHRSKAHKVRRPAARFVRDGVCPRCRVNFHCRTRAMAHLEKGARNCREALMKGLLPELLEEELREADQELVRYRRQARSEGDYQGSAKHLLIHFANRHTTAFCQKRLRSNSRTISPPQPPDLGYPIGHLNIWIEIS